ncbi:hypothetical protein [Campylobacter hyointestinalis]|nr:hypothetical protein [Campylobacter hyointestinalis]
MTELENSVKRISSFNLQGFLVNLKKALENFSKTMKTTIYKKG